MCRFNEENGVDAGHLYELHRRVSLYTAVLADLREYGAPQERIDRVQRKLQEIIQATQHAESSIGGRLWSYETP